MDYRIKDLPRSERPRERLAHHGPGALSTAELIAIILRTGSQTKNVKQLATELLDQLGIERLQQAGMEELKQFNGMGEVKAGQLLAAFELIDRVGKQNVETIASFQQAQEHFTQKLRRREQEELHAAFLSSSNKLIDTKQIFKGSLQSVQIKERDIVRHALTTNASAVILAHNHPGGDAEPTQADIQATKDIQNALQQFDVTLLDHIIVGQHDCCSLKKLGCI